MKAKEVARFGKSSGPNGGIIERTLVVYELKTCYKAELWNSSFIGWKGVNHQPIQSAKFYEKDGDKDLFRVAEYFGFSMSEQIR